MTKDDGVSPLSEARAKVERALAHADRLADYLADWVRHNLGESVLAGKYVQTQSHFVVVLGHLPEPPQAASLVLGDALHNLRCAVDYLAWVLFGRGEVAATHDRPEDVQFPIVATPRIRPGRPPRSAEAVFEDAARKNLPGVSPDLIARVRARQPFVVSPVNPEGHALATLQVLSNEDKHRRLRLTTLDVQSLDWRIVGQTDFKYAGAYTATLERFEPGAKVGVVPGVTTGPKPELRIHATIEVRIVVGGFEEAATDMLRRIAGEVTAVLDEFEPLL